MSITKMFKDLSVGQEFDFVRPNSTINSFFDLCVKTSARKYKSLVTGMEYSVGSIYCEVFHSSTKG